MSQEHHNAPGKQRLPRVEVYWHSISYRTVALYGGLLLGLVLLVLYLVFPATFAGAFERFAAAFGPDAGGGAAPSATQARFVNLDGTVMVKKVNSVEWVKADLRMLLDKGDLIRTGPDSAARIIAGEATYTVKADTLVTVEENAVDTNQATHSGVHLANGAVDLSTGSWGVPGSSAKVSFEDAVASLRQNSRAAVRSDPARNEHEITVTAGGAEVQRGEELIPVERWERLSVSGGGPVVKSRVLAPPDLVEPVNFQPLISPDPSRTTVRFAWKPVPNAVAYHLRVGTSSMFSHVVREARVSGTSTAVSGLRAGDYFWSVTAIDASNRSSAPSEPSRFTLVAQGKGEELLLEIEGTQLHGNVVEIIGRTEPGATILINGQAVANIQPDGRFRHFTEPLPRGTHTIKIVGQNRRGATTPPKPVTVVVP